VLDARIISVIASPAFDARLENGHEFVAVWRPEDPHEPGPKPGDRVRVRFSPFDMSTGQIMGPAGRTQ